jgi:hypothetical protein
MPAEHAGPFAAVRLHVQFVKVFTSYQHYVGTMWASG